MRLDEDSPVDDPKEDLNLAQSLAQTLIAQGKHGEAEALLENSLGKTQGAHGPLMTRQASALGVLARAQLLLEKPQSALNAHQQAFELRMEAMELVLPGRSQAEARNWLLLHSPLPDRILDLLAQPGAGARQPSVCIRFAQ